MIAMLEGLRGGLDSSADVNFIGVSQELRNHMALHI